MALVAPVAPTWRSDCSGAESLKVLRNRVNKTRHTLVQEYGKVPGLLTSSEIESILRDLSRSKDSSLTSPHHPNELSSYRPYDPGGPQSEHPDQRHHSLRDRHKIAKLALTLAAWDGNSEPKRGHWIEAGFYRPERLLLAY